MSAGHRRRLGNDRLFPLEGLLQGAVTRDTAVLCSRCDGLLWQGVFCVASEHAYRRTGFAVTQPGFLFGRGLRGKPGTGHLRTSFLQWPRT